MRPKDKHSHYLQTISIRPEVLNAAAIIAQNGAQGLARLINPKTGRFNYVYHAKTGQPGKGYSVLRHCGTCWAMLDVYQNTESSNKKVLRAVHRGIRRVLRRYRVPSADSKHHCIITPWRDEMRLGGNGLAILALLSFYHHSGKQSYLDEAISLGRYVMTQEMPDGDFYHYRTYSTDEHMENKRCDYYPGECLYGLIELYHATGAPEWLDFVTGNTFHVGSDYGIGIRSHWMIYALESLYRASPDSRYLMQAELTVKQMLVYLNKEYVFRTNRCCSIATQTEGILAYLRMCLRRDGATYTPIFHEALDAVRRCLSYQYSQQQSDGNFLLGGTEMPIVRIDSTQHNISGFLHYALMESALPPL